MMNSCNFVGRLVRDPELSYTPNTQTAVCKFTIAVDRPRRNGEDQGADFLKIVVYGGQAESCDQYLSKGRQVAVVSSARTGSYVDKETNKKVYTTEYVASNVEFLGGGKPDAQNSNKQPAPQQQPQQQTFQDVPGTAAGDFSQDDGGFGDFFEDVP